MSTSVSGAMSSVKLPVGWTLIHREQSESTNIDCRSLVADGAPHGTVLVADRQTKGRGRQDRSWESIDGNLTFSVIVRPDCTLAESGKLSFLTAIALCEAIERLAPKITIKCKWPNDVLGAKGKIAGILLEGCGLKDGKPSAVICGVGVNMDWRPEINALYPASSLIYEGAGHLERKDLLQEFIISMDRWLLLWLTNGFEPLRQAWLSRARGIGELITVRLTNETFQGRFESLDADGGLVLSDISADNLDEKRIIRAGDVFFE